MNMPKAYYVVGTDVMNQTLMRVLCSACDKDEILNGAHIMLPGFSRFPTVLRIL